MDLSKIFTDDVLLLLQVMSLALASILILLQNRGSGLSGTFGGGSEVYLTRRGVEKVVVNLTVISIITFIVFRVASFYV